MARLADHPVVIVPCVDAAFDAGTGNSQLLLRDLSDSHAAPLSRDQQLDGSANIPAREQLEAVIDALARLHAYWWQHPRLSSGVALLGAWCSSEAHFVNEVARRRLWWYGCSACPSCAASAPRRRRVAELAALRQLLA